MPTNYECLHPPMKHRVGPDVIRRGGPSATITCDRCGWWRLAAEGWTEWFPPPVKDHPGVGVMIGGLGADDPDLKDGY